mmetsp:Transcript_10905/g.27560  ORF Transcript_10905/g.27560 Transcript_10905/m.27560 type:complete len:276 (+) Transcript_10905:178-1005(+)
MFIHPLSNIRRLAEGSTSNGSIVKWFIVGIKTFHHFELLTDGDTSSVVLETKPKVHVSGCLEIQIPATDVLISDAAGSSHEERRNKVHVRTVRSVRHRDQLGLCMAFAENQRVDPVLGLGGEQAVVLERGLVRFSFAVCCENLATDHVRFVAFHELEHAIQVGVCGELKVILDEQKVRGLDLAQQEVESSAHARVPRKTIVSNVVELFANSFGSDGVRSIVGNIDGQTWIECSNAVQKTEEMLWSVQCFHKHCQQVRVVGSSCLLVGLCILSPSV